MAPIVSNDYKARKRQEILDSALKCFVRKGFEATSVDDICAESGVSKGSIYTYFKSKDEIYIELTIQHTQNGFQYMRKRIKDCKTSFDKLEYLFENYERGFDDDDLGRLVVSLEFRLRSIRFEEINTILTDLRQKYYVTLIEEVIEDGQKNGEFNTNSTAKEYAELYWTMMMGFQVHSIYKDFPYEKIIKELKEMYIQRIKL